MLIAVFVYLLAAGPTMPLGSQAPVPDSPVEIWSAEQVRHWAADQAPVAGLFEQERRALGAALDRDNAEQTAQVGLLQAVLRRLAERDRETTARDALELYYRVISLEQQRELLVEADKTLGSMIEQAERAAELDLADGNSNQLRQQLLAVEDQRYQLDAGIQKSRRGLARLTGRPPQVVTTASLSDPLPTLPTSVAVEDPLNVALANRSDLAAAEIICRCLNDDSLPAARSLMSIFQPGIGLAVAASSRSLLGGLHQRDGAADLACRRQQCRLLQDRIRDTIADEVAITRLELTTSAARLQVANDRAGLASQQSQQAAAAVELGQLQPGQERQVQLETLRLRGEVVERQLALAIAEVQHLVAQGILLRSPPSTN